MNLHAVRAIFRFEMARTWRTIMQSVISPVISTSLYFIVFGAAIGSRIPQVEGVSYGAFIVPGLIMLSLLTQSISNASFGIYFPKFSGTIYELLSAPVSPLEVVLSYVGAAATKSIMLGLIILVTSALFVPLRVAHPFWMLLFLVLTSGLSAAVDRLVAEGTGLTTPLVLETSSGFPGSRPSWPRASPPGRSGNRCRADNNEIVIIKSYVEKGDERPSIRDPGRPGGRPRGLFRGGDTGLHRPRRPEERRGLGKRRSLGGLPARQP